MDRLDLLLTALVFFGIGRVQDPQFVRDLKRKLIRRLHGEPWEERIRNDVKKRRAA